MQIAMLDSLMIHDVKVHLAELSRVLRKFEGLT